MKKYICIYAILCAILLILFVTHGIPYGNIIREQTHELAMDEGKTTWILLTYNIVIGIAVLAVGIVVSCIKDNKIRLKWLFPIGMLVFNVALVPIFKIATIGGFIREEIDYFLSLLKFFAL